jgi:hypothetical protein
MYTVHGGAFLRLNDALIPIMKLDDHLFLYGLVTMLTYQNLKHLLTAGVVLI